MVRRGALFAGVAMAVLLAGLATWWLTRGHAASGDASVIEATAARAGGVELPRPLEPRPATPATKAEPPVLAPTAAAAERRPADPRFTPDGTSRLFRGWAIDGRGEPLANHLLQLYVVEEGKQSARLTLESQVESGRDGHFAFVGIAAGTKLLKLRGPGGGDLPVLTDDGRVLREAAEGRMYMSIADAGLIDASVVGPRHAAFWVQGCAIAPVDPAELKQWHFTMVVPRLQDPAAPLPLPPCSDWKAPPPEPDVAEPVLHLNLPSYQRWRHDCFLVGADRDGDTRLVVGCDGFGSQFADITELGLLRQAPALTLQRVAGLALSIVDANDNSGVTIGEATVRELGGGQPDRVTRLDLSADYYEYLEFWSTRASGRYELSVRALGYADWTGSGELVIGRYADGPPVVRAELHRAR